MTLAESIIVSFNKHILMTAVVYRGQEYSYENFLTFVTYRYFELKQQIHSSDLLVSIDIDDPFDHWISTITLMMLGIISSPEKSVDGLPDDLRGKRHLGCKDDSEIKVTSFSKINLTDSVNKQIIFEPNKTDINRLFFTSGTTGIKKAIGISESQIISRLKSRTTFFPKNSICFSLMPPFSTLGYHFQLEQWLHGGTVILDKNFDDIKNSLQKYPIEYLVGSPHQYTSLLTDIQTLNELKINKVDEIVISGGETTKILKEKLKNRFNSKITCLFGASETGYWSKNDVTDNDDYSNLGCADIGTEIQVEDMSDDGIGILKIKNQHMVNRYLSGEVASNFKEGWFYPGDRAFQKENQIYLLGRDDTVVNVGGIKISPQQIDDYLIGQDGVKDAACFWIKDKFGYNELWSAVVIEENSSLENLMAKSKVRFGIDGGPKRIIPVEFIPRTYSGKPQRNLMSEKITSQINLLKS